MGGLILFSVEVGYCFWLKGRVIFSYINVLKGVEPFLTASTWKAGKTNLGSSKQAAA